MPSTISDDMSIDQHLTVLEENANAAKSRAMTLSTEANNSLEGGNTTKTSDAILTPRSVTINKENIYINNETDSNKKLNLLQLASAPVSEDMMRSSSEGEDPPYAHPSKAPWYEHEIPHPDKSKLRKMY